MKRLRTFDQYWTEEKHPSANEAWRVCAQERDEVIADLRKDLGFALNYIDNISASYVAGEGREVYVREVRNKWGLE